MSAFVIVEVSGGSAEVTHNASDVDVRIVDWDNLEEEECPNCGASGNHWTLIVEAADRFHCDECGTDFTLED